MLRTGSPQIAPGEELLVAWHRKRVRSVFGSLAGVAALACLNNVPENHVAFVKVELRAEGSELASWEIPVSAYFRLRGVSWQLVGFERLPE